MLNKSVLILGIETSCDETAVAVIQGASAHGLNSLSHISVLSNVVFSQIALPRPYFGVYPELASRAHLEKILPVLEKALSEAKITIRQIDVLAVTTGPGLVGSLLVGVNFAKTLSFVYQKPIVPVNHLEGHIYANFVGKLKIQSSNVKVKIPEFPAVVLIVSGGHTLLALMKNHLQYKIIGETLDDAAGEAFDKVAALLGLNYPGGPEIERAAQESKLKTTFERSSSAAKADYVNVKTSVQNLKLPRPMIESKDFNFSFSGLKTAVLYLTQKIDAKKYKPQIAAEFQQAVVDVLVAKTIKAAQKFKVKSIILSGGVAANELLRMTLRKEAAKLNMPFYAPPRPLCTDNAVGMGVAAHHKLLAKQVKKWYDVDVNANLQLGE